MAKHWISYLLATLIAFQSVAAIADVHQSHQSGIDHLEFNHEHASQALDQDSQDPADNRLQGPTADDCHHCCHCHVVCHFFISGNQQDIAFTEPALSPQNKPLAYSSNIGFPNFRPPIF